MSIQGSLTSVPIPDLFTLLLQLRKTGVLTIVSEREERAFHFHGGNLVYATTRDDSQRLGSYLVRLGFLDEKDLEEVFATSPGKESYFGQRVLERNHVTQEQLSAAVRVQIAEILYEVMSWESGAFHFDDTDLPAGAPGQVLVSTTSVIFEIAQKRDETGQVRELFPDGEAIYGPAKKVDPAGLSENESTVFDIVDGTKTVDQVFLESPLPPADTAEALGALASRKAVIRVLKARRSLDSPAPEMKCLPVAPAVAVRLFAVLNFERGDALAAGVREIVSDEPLLAAKLLRMMDLSNVEVAGPGLDLDRLIDKLGLFRVRCGLIPEATRDFFFPQNNYYWADLWSQTRQCAALCRGIAREVGYEHPEEAFLAGLLHNLGAFLLLQHAPKRYMQLVAQSVCEETDLETLERKSYNISHTDLGAMYAEKWNFPDNIVRVIREHHDKRAARKNRLLQIVGAAKGVLRERGVSIGFHKDADKHLEKCLSALKLDRGRAEDLLAAVRRDLGLELGDEGENDDGEAAEVCAEETAVDTREKAPVA